MQGREVGRERDGAGVKREVLRKFFEGGERVGVGEKEGERAEGKGCGMGQKRRVGSGS